MKLDTFNILSIKSINDNILFLGNNLTRSQQRMVNQHLME